MSCFWRKSHCTSTAQYDRKGGNDGGGSWSRSEYEYRTVRDCVIFLVLIRSGARGSWFGSGMLPVCPYPLNAAGTDIGTGTGTITCVVI